MNQLFCGPFKSLRNQSCASVPHPWACPEMHARRAMKQVRQYLHYSSRSRHYTQLYQVAVGTSNFLAITCLFFGAAFASLVPASLEQRLGSSLLFGLMPAVCLYLGGQILGRGLAIGAELCELSAERCFRGLVSLVNNFAIYLSPPTSDESARFFSSRSRALSLNAFCSVKNCYWRADAAIFDFSCLLVRSSARFILRLEASRVVQRSR